MLMISSLPQERCINSYQSQGCRFGRELKISALWNIVTNSRVTPSWRDIVSLTFSEAGVLHVNWTSLGHCNLRANMVDHPFDECCIPVPRKMSSLKEKQPKKPPPKRIRNVGKSKHVQLTTSSSSDSPPSDNKDLPSIKLSPRSYSRALPNRTHHVSRPKGDKTCDVQELGYSIVQCCPRC
ncbi:hypothetical protein Tco_0700311 [Tanacetum coccineum]